MLFTIIGGIIVGLIVIGTVYLTYWEHVIDRPRAFVNAHNAEIARIKERQQRE